MSVTLLRHAKLEAVTLNQMTGVDGQGKSTFGANNAINGRVIRRDEVIKDATGADVKVNVTAWFDAAQTPLPMVNDKLTFADGLVGIVVKVDKVETLQSGVLDHVKVYVRES